MLDQSEPSAAFSRRRMVGAGLAFGTAAAVGPLLLPQTATAGTPAPTAAATPAAPPTVSSLIAGEPFYIAHRGGGRDWPELTSYAYQQATALPGLQALELSVCITKDKVLVLSHDVTTTSATGRNFTIANCTWSDISGLMVSARNTLDPSQPARPITRYSQVIYPYLGDFVVFAEPKLSAATVNLWWNLREMAQPERVVWKQPINSALFGKAKQEGWSTWGYVLNQSWLLGDNLKRYAASPDIDMLGAPLSESDAFVTDVVNAGRANGKPVIAWAASTAADRDRALRLGCVGVMASEIKGLLNTGLGAPLNR